MRSSLLPPGPKYPTPLQTARWIRSPVLVLESGAARFGTPFMMRINGKPPAVIVSKPEHVREVFTGSPEIFRASAGRESFRRNIGPGSLFALDGPEFRRHRRLIRPAFQPDRVADHGERIWTQTLAEVRHWPCGRTVRFIDAADRITLDLILQTVFGVTDESGKARLRDAVIELKKAWLSSLTFLAMLSWDPSRLGRWSRYQRARRTLDGIIYVCIRAARAAAAARTDVLGRLVQGTSDDEPLTDEEIHDELITFLMAGHATTTAALAWTMQWILSSSEIHGRAREEVRDLFANGYAYSAVTDAVYVEAAIRESMRITPPILLMSRELACDHSFVGYDLPKGVVLRPCPYLTHRDPTVFENPEQYRPERFLETKPSPFEYYPFGGGARVCVGLSYAMFQMRVVVAAILSSADLVPRAAPTSKTRRLAALVAPAHGTPLAVESHRPLSRFAGQTTSPRRVLAS